ncbi:unnamed protein product [Owenia fusiformis]|uniref:Uncharacterized protein n=1 Tax=Owenia fusiformis TaxID=6347 RepID=A0A8J1YC01_OWEFU|nr:unnamed protein product [Owenia fusiformis]
MSSGRVAVFALLILVEVLKVHSKMMVNMNGSTHIDASYVINNTFRVINESHRQIIPLKMETDEEVIPFTIISSLLCASSVAANVIAIVTIYNIPGTMSVNHLLFINLSIADLLGTLSTYLETVFRAGLHWDVISNWGHYNDVVVIGYTGFAFFYIEASLTLLIFAIMRFIAIKFPMKYNVLFTKVRVCECMGISWIGSGIVAIPGIFGLSIIKQNLQTNLEFKYWNYVWPAVVIIIFLCVISLYSTVSKRLLQRRASAVSRNQARDNYGAFITTVILMSTLVVSSMPYAIVKIVRFAQYNEALIAAYHNFICYLPYFNFMSDPIIYSLRTKDIRLAYRRTFPCIPQEYINAPTNTFHSHNGVTTEQTEV